MKIIKLIIGIVATATLISPVDALPDLVPIVGWLDDVLAAGFLLKELLDLIRSKRNPRSD